MITSVLSVVMVRVEASDLRAESALLAELFVEDMEGQLRELGTNDVVVGKRMGKLMSVLGGRLGAYRSALLAGDSERLAAAVERNTNFTDGGSAECVAKRLLALAETLAKIEDETLIAAEIPV